MPYVVAYKESYKQLAFTDALEQLYSGSTDINETTFQQVPYRETITRSINQRQLTALRNKRRDQIRVMLRAYQNLRDKIRNFERNIEEGYPQEYYTFTIPKRSGGVRTITAPSERLKALQRDIKQFLEESCGLLAHNAAFAYVPKRSTVDALKVHQANNSKWFLKLDIKDFFPSCDKTTVATRLRQIFPLSELSVSEIDELIMPCLLNNALPQGAITSPTLCNLIMIGTDHKLTSYCYRNHMRYTRYADDILISSYLKIDTEEVLSNIRGYLYPFVIKDEKTRFGSIAGRNWNLGLMLNKDNNITLGYKKKHNLKAGIFNFLSDFTNGNVWSIMDVHQLLGNVSYWKMIEPDYVNYVVSKYNQKFNLNFDETAKNIIRGTV